MFRESLDEYLLVPVSMYDVASPFCFIITGTIFFSCDSVREFSQRKRLLCFTASVQKAPPRVFAVRNIGWKMFRVAVVVFHLNCISVIRVAIDCCSTRQSIGRFDTVASLFKRSLYFASRHFPARRVFSVLWYAFHYCILFFKPRTHGRNATESLVEALSYFFACYVIRTTLTYFVRRDKNYCITRIYDHSERVHCCFFFFQIIITCRALLSTAVEPPATGASR